MWRLATVLPWVFYSSLATATAHGLGEPSRGVGPVPDPVLPLSDFVVQVWDASRGLPFESIEAVAQTPDGYLWLGTEVGLIRFDGASFTLYDSRTTPELTDLAIYLLVVDSTGALWIFTHAASSPT